MFLSFTHKFFQNSLTFPWLLLKFQNSLTNFKIPWQFPDLEKFFFSLTFSLTVDTLFYVHVNSGLQSVCSFESNSAFSHLQNFNWNETRPRKRLSGPVLTLNLKPLISPLHPSLSVMSGQYLSFIRPIAIYTTFFEFALYGYLMNASAMPIDNTAAAETTSDVNE